MHDAGVVLMVMIMVGLGVLVWIVRLSRANSMVQQWAEQNGFRLIECQRRSIFKGPYFFANSRIQEVYEIRVEDRDGNVRHGYVRVGGFVTGLLSNRVDVKWTD